MSTSSSSSSTICSASPGREPWDYWLQCLRAERHDKLPLSDFCQVVLLQVGVAATATATSVHQGIPRRSSDVEPPPRRELDVPLSDRHQLARSRALQHAAIIEAYRTRVQPRTTMWCW